MSKPENNQHVKVRIEQLYVEPEKFNPILENNPSCAKDIIEQCMAIENPTGIVGFVLGDGLFRCAQNNPEIAKVYIEALKIYREHNKGLGNGWWRAVSNNNLSECAFTKEFIGFIYDHLKLYDEQKDIVIRPHVNLLLSEAAKIYPEAVLRCITYCKDIDDMEDICRQIVIARPDLLMQSPIVEQDYGFGCYGYTNDNIDKFRETALKNYEYAKYKMDKHKYGDSCSFDTLSFLYECSVKYPDLEKDFAEILIENSKNHPDKGYSEGLLKKPKFREFALNNYEYAKYKMGKHKYDDSCSFDELCFLYECSVKHPDLEKNYTEVLIKNIERMLGDYPDTSWEHDKFIPAKNREDVLKVIRQMNDKGRITEENKFAVICLVVNIGGRFAKDYVDIVDNYAELGQKYLIGDLWADSAEIDAETAFKKIKELQSSFKTEEVIDVQSFDCLFDVVKNNPRFTKDLIDISGEELLKTFCHKNTWLRQKICHILGDIAKEGPEVTKDVLDVFAVALQNPENTTDSLKEFYNILGDIAKEGPEVTKDVLDVFAVAVQNPNNNIDSLYCGYRNMAEIVKNNQELAENVPETPIVGLDDVIGIPEFVVTHMKKEKEKREKIIVRLSEVESNLEKLELQQKDWELQQKDWELQQKDWELQQKDKEQIEKTFLEGVGISDMSTDERQALFERSNDLRKTRPVMQDVSLTTMCRIYVAEEDKKTKLGFLKALFQIRKEGKTNAEKKEMADTFARVLDNAPELKKDDNLVRLSKRDTFFRQPTREVRDQVRRA